MVRDLTSGKPVSLIVGFSVPLLFGNLFQQLYNMVDTVIVGKFVGITALAAVGATGSISFLIIGFLIGLCSGFSINVAQSFGAGDMKEMRRYVANSLYLCGIAAIVLTTLTMLSTRGILVIMKTPDDIMEQSYSYIIIIFGGMVITMLYNILAAILRALGDTKTPLIFLAIASVMNALLDLLFVVILRFGVAGAAIATLISQGVSAVLCLIYIIRRYPVLHIEKDEAAFSTAHCKKLLGIGVPMALQFSITAVGAIVLQTATNKLGSGIVASVTAANKIQMLVTQPMDTLGITMATFCGQNLGAGRPDRIKQGIRQSVLLSVGYCILACLFVWTLSGKIAFIFIDSTETAILNNLQYFLRVNGVLYPVLGVLFVFRNSLQGMGYSMFAMTAGVCELVARVLVAVLLVGVLGFFAICIAGPAAWLAADLLLIPTYIFKMKKLSEAYSPPAKA